MQNINFNASEVAALINKNPYKSQEEALHDLLCRVKKQKNTKDLDKFSIISKEDLLKLLDTFNTENMLDKSIQEKLEQELKKTNDTKIVSKKLFENISKNSIDTKCTENSKKTQQNLEAKLDSIIKKDTKEVKQYLNGFINKQRGIKNENKIIDKYQKKNNTKISNNNDCLYKMKLFDLDKFTFNICGKIDGIENNELIEIKNRRNHLFTTIPIYEQIQTEIYFRLTNLNKGKLIQNYNDTQSIFVININQELWDTILNELFTVAELIIQNCK